MNNLKYVYNLGLKDDLLNNTLTSETYQAKLAANHALQANLHILTKQVNLLKSYTNSTVTNLESFAQVLDSLALCLIKRNVQAYNYELNKLTRYGEKLSLVRKEVYKEQNTEKGFLGTLLIYQTTNFQEFTINNFIERLLINYWNHLEIDYLKTPRERFELVLAEVDLVLNQDYYADLTEEILTLITNDFSIKKKFNGFLLDYSELDNLLYRLITLNIDDDLELFLDWLFINEKSTFDIKNILTKIINYKPVGGLNLVLVSFLIEGLALASRYIKDLPIEYRNLSVDKFIVLEETAEYSQQIAKYLALSYDAVDWLVRVFEEFGLLKEAITADLVKFMKEPIIAKGQYRIDV